MGWKISRGTLTGARQPGCWGQTRPWGLRFSEGNEGRLRHTTVSLNLVQPVASHCLNQPALEVVVGRQVPGSHGPTLRHTTL